MTSRNIVIAASQWNPTIFTADWLNAKTAVHDFATEIVIAPLAVTKSAPFNVVCQPEKLQVVQNDPGRAGGELSALARAIVEGLPETRFSATGLNFQDTIRFTSEAELRAFVTRYVVVREIPGFCQADDPELAITAHLSKLTSDWRLTVKFLWGESAGTPCLVVDFNFHFETNKLAAVQTALGRYSECVTQAEHILRRLRDASV